MSSDNSDKAIQLSRSDIACLVAFIVSGSSNLSMKEYAIMSKIDGTRTASSYDHAFRSIKKEATEIAKKIANGGFNDVEAPVSKINRGTTGKNAVTPTKATKKTPAKQGRKMNIESTPDDGADESEHPSKKIKKEHIQQTDYVDDDHFQQFKR